MQLITDTVNTLNTHVEYDINVWAEADDKYLRLTFYPLMYPGDLMYPDTDLEHGFPVVNTSEFYGLKIPKQARGPRFVEALKYLEDIVKGESFENEWHLDGMDWWSCEPSLTNPPELIRDFMAKLPRRNKLQGGDIYVVVR